MSTSLFAPNAPQQVRRALPPQTTAGNSAAAGMVAPGNINLNARPTVHNPDGSISTVRSITVTDEQGRATLIPTVVGGKVVSNKQAIAYWRKTGQNLGTFTDETSADAYAQTLHQQQAREYAKPDLGPAPTGPPVPVLVQHNFFGDIGQFAQHVQQITDQHVQRFGVRPQPDVMLKAALDPAEQANLFAPSPTEQTLAAHPIQTSEELLRTVGAAAHDGGTAGYQDWMDKHGDQLNALAKLPGEQPKVTKAISDAKQAAAFTDRMNTSPGLGGTLELYGKTIKQGAVLAAKTTDAAARVFASLDQATPTGAGAKAADQHANATIGGFQEIAPAIAQVVKGLVYSPAGLFDIAKAISLDTKAAAAGDFRFTRTIRIAKQSGQAFLQDLNDPGGHAGYLALDLFGLGSAVTGTAARLGRFGEGGLRAAAAPHPLRTVPLEKNGFAEDISLSGSPLTAFLQENIPFFGTKAQQARLSGEARFSTNLSGETIDALGPQDRVTLWTTHALAPENRIGRAGNIRRNTEFKAAMGLKAELDGATGSTTAATRFERVLPKRWFDGLSKGEVKALQALSWDDPHPLAAEEHFHQSMIEQGIGNKAAHEQNIALLGLARKALENPSPRFVKTLDVYGRIVAETERLRIGMGLGVDLAENRIARAGAVLREEPTTGMEGRVSPTSWYTPTIPKGKAQGRNLAETPFQRGKSVVGFGPPTGTNLFNHEMTGDALRAGDIRTDAHHLAGEGYSRTVRAMQVIGEHQNAWDRGTLEPTSPHDIPVRDIREVPDALREAITQFYDGHIDAATAESLPPEVHQWLFPEPSSTIEHVRYIDPRLLGNAAKPNLPVGWGARMSEKVNNILRPWILYGPKYALNKLGNASMLVLDQGFLRSGQNIARAMTADNHLSATALARLKSLTGAGRSESYVNPRSGHFSQGLADYWSKMTDNSERMASFLYYADRKGYHSWADLERLLGEDPSVAADLNDVSRRSDEALVAFDRMSPWEKATLRHYIFVYPWQRGATIWAFRTVMEHPAKTAILAQLGQEAYQNDPWLQHAAQWVRRVGYIPLWWNGNNPVVADPTSVNSFSTLSQMLQTLKAVVEGDKYAATGDLFGPPGQFAVHAILGVDQNGNAYPGSQWLGAAEETFNFLPLLAALKRHQKGVGKVANLPPFDPANRASLQTRYNAALKQVVLTPGWLGGFGNIFAGGFTPRELNVTADAARYWRDATPAQRHQREVQLLNDAVTLQGDYLKQPVPTGVRQAIRDASQITMMGQQFQTAHGRSPTAKEKLLLTLKYLQEAGRVSPGAAGTLTAAANKLETLPDISQMSSAVMVKYGHAAELHAWDSNVSTLVSLSRPADFNQRISTLFQHGLSSQRLFHLTEAQRLDYGRKYVAYQNERADLAKQVKGRADAAAQLRIFDDTQDKPVGALPSPARFLYSEGNTDTQQQRLDRLVNTPWASLSGVEKAALGRKVPPNISEAWTNYEVTVKAMRARDGSVTKDGKAAVAKTINREYSGFMQDWLYAQLPRAERFERTTVYQDLPDRQVFAPILASAKQYAAAIKQYGHSDYYKAHWRDYVAKTVVPGLAQHKQLAAAIKALGSGFLEGLIANG